MEFKADKGPTLGTEFEFYKPPGKPFIGLGTPGALREDNEDKGCELSIAPPPFLPDAGIGF